MATPNLSYYLSQTQLLLHDTPGTLYSTTDLTSYINSARSQLSLETECVRFNYGYDGIPFVGTFTAGSNTISVLSLASILDTIQGWTLVGPAYITPGTTVVSSGGTSIVMSTNALASSGTPLPQFIISPPNLTSNLVEQYALPTQLSATLGINAGIGVKSITVNWGGAGGSNAYMLDYWDWTSFQAYLRFYGQTGLQGNPAVWTRYQNNILIRPVPTQAYPMQWDTTCSVFDLVDDNSPEAIPYPFTDAVPYYAAYMALLNGQRAGDAQQMKERYEEYIRRARAFWQRSIIPTMYPNAGYR
jgi:hypothetical protein